MSVNLITWTENRNLTSVPAWTDWTGKVGEIACFFIVPSGDTIHHDWLLRCELPGEGSAWHGSVASLKRKAEAILSRWLKKASLQMKAKTQYGPPVTVKRLVGCARCGRTHRHLVFLPLLRPVRVLTHWASCPTTGEPIMMVIRATQ